MAQELPSGEPVVLRPAVERPKSEGKTCKGTCTSCARASSCPAAKLTVSPTDTTTVSGTQR